MSVKIKDSHKIQLADGEEPHDQQLSIFVDENTKDLVLLDSVLNEADMIARNPVSGKIDLKNDLGGKSIKELLDDIPDTIEDVFTDPGGEGIESFSDANMDRIGVNDSKWLRNKELLIWKSAVLAQIKAKLTAIEMFKRDYMDLNKMTSEEEKAIIAERARQLSAELLDMALNEIKTANDAISDSKKEAVAKTKKYIGRFIVTDKEAIEKGGLTKEEMDTLFVGGDE